ncbi:MAG TPA: GDSL-type esterase/lipase family protein [Verrucomicrobiae bacterium]|nr:GDSL-type esterase/lipase family protein [Verrucomicrobiae bacterium]
MRNQNCSPAAVLPRINIQFLNIRFIVFLLAAICFPQRPLAELPPQKPVWEPEIRAFESRDRIHPPPQNAILFIGSSAIRKWTTLAKDFPGIQVINRGFGGSEIDDSTAYAGRIIFPYHPRIIVLYAGDNDLAAGRSPDEVVAEYTNFVGVIHARLPQTRIVFVSIKASLSRWKLKNEIIETNKRIAAIHAENLAYVDVFTRMLGPDGKPRRELLLADGLHPDEQCYRLWASLIRPELN